MSDPSHETRRTDAEYALRERMRRDRSLLDVALDAIVDMNESGTITDWNAQAGALFGWSHAEAVGRPLHETIIPPSLRSAHRRGVERFLTTGETTILNRRIEITAVHRDGHEFPVELAVAALREGEHHCFRAFIRDLSERRRGEHEREQLQARMQQAQKLEQLGLLAGGVAHDFNNLLAAILGHAGLARQELPSDSPVLAQIDEIISATQRAAELTRQLLAYAGRGRVILAPLDLAVLVEELTQLLRPVLSNKANVHLEVATAPIAGDASQIRQVIMNLLTNASEALEGNPGDIVVRTGVKHATSADLASPYLSEDRPEGEYAFVSVSDTGRGMDSQTLSKVFDPFFTTKFTGRGLGLAAVLGIVRGHNGSIQVRSELGIGSTFLVLLPRAPATAAKPADANSAPPELRGHGVILVVDDEDFVRDVIARVLQHTGFKVLTAADGQEALKVFAAEPEGISAVVLDLTMPRLDGLELLRLLRRLRPDVRVLLMSGYSDQEIATRVGGERLPGFLQKPFRNADLTARLSALLRT